MKEATAARLRLGSWIGARNWGHGERGVRSSPHRGCVIVMSPQVLVQHEEVPQDLFDICDMQCPPPSKRFSGWASDEQSPAVIQASGEDGGGKPVLREPLSAKY
jgi:hypothetical protein